MKICLLMAAMKGEILNGNQCVGFLVDAPERGKFALRLARACGPEVKLIILTTEPISYVEAIAVGVEAHLLRRHGATRATSAGAEEGALRAIEVLNGQMAPRRAAADFQELTNDIAAVFRRREIARCLIWNGQQLLGRAARNACALSNVQPRFLEIANLPSKLFVDDCGVNAESSLARDPDALLRLPAVSEASHAEWFADYEAKKRLPPPQAVRTVRSRVESIANQALKRLVGGSAQLNLKARAAAGVRFDSARPWLQGKDRQPYLFLPLQVSSDTQIKLHSPVDNLGAIRHGLDLARQHGLALVVKPHPAERDPEFARELDEKLKSETFFVSNDNTNDLISSAERVLTINSTVGLEAMLYGKPVTCIGAALYAKFTREHLLRYVHRFLVSDVDYFGREEIHRDAARRIIYGDE